MATDKARCKQCGEFIIKGSRFCEACGAALNNDADSKKRIKPAARSASESGKNSITWDADLPLLSNSVIIKQLLLVLVASSLCVLVFILTLEAFEGNLNLGSALRYLLITLLILGGLSFLAVIVMLVFYGNRYEYKFTMNETGVTSETVGGTRKKNAIVNLLLVLSGKPGPAGAGLIGASRQSETVKWEKVDSIHTDPEKLEIVLRRKGRAIMLIRCTPENYQAVLQMAEDALSHRSR